MTGIDKWMLPEVSARGEADLRLEDYEGKPCYAGLDLSTTTDLTALVLAFPNDIDGLDVFAWAWCPAESAELRERRDRVPYRDWARRGYIELTDGNVVDYDSLFNKVVELSKRFDIVGLGADRWNASQLINQLQGAGIEVIAVGQGFKDLSDPTKQTERQILAGTLRHARTH